MIHFYKIYSVVSPTCLYFFFLIFKFLYCLLKICDTLLSNFYKWEYLYLKFLCFSLHREGYWFSLIVLYFLVCFCKCFIEYCLLSFQCYLLQFLSAWVQVQFHLIGLAFIRLSFDWLTYLDYLKQIVHLWWTWSPNPHDTSLPLWIVRSDYLFSFY